MEIIPCKFISMAAGIREERDEIFLIKFGTRNFWKNLFSFHIEGSANFLNGAILADRQKFIVVNVAYRLAVFGYAWNSEFMKEDGVMGNWGTHDQRMALIWVNRYIHNVGGDPSQVTISGCSAGAQSTMVHLTSPDSWPYFSKIVSFSSPNGFPYKNMTEAAMSNTEFFQNAGCCLDSPFICKQADIECLRSKSIEEIQLAAWTPLQALPEVRVHLLFWSCSVI